MLNPKSHIDAESEDLLYETEDEISGLVYLMWGNFGKNPRRREIDWPQHKLKGILIYFFWVKLLY